MRRSTPALVTFAALLAMAAPAHGAEEGAPAPTRTAIDLACESTVTDGGLPGISCEWSAVDGAAAYRVMGSTRRGRTIVTHVRRTEDTSFSHAAKPGTYLIGVQAIDEDRKPLGRSPRVKVVVERGERPARPARPERPARPGRPATEDAATEAPAEGGGTASGDATTA